MLCMVLLCIVSFLPAANFVDENAADFGNTGQ